MIFSLAALPISVALLFGATAIFFFYQNKFMSVLLSGLAGLVVFLAIGAMAGLILAYLRPAWLRDDRSRMLLFIAIQAFAIVAAAASAWRVWRKIQTLGPHMDQ